jgi:hypothetical protein
MVRTLTLFLGLLQRPGITSLEASAAFSVADQKSEERSYTSTASSVVQIHATEAGYHVGMEYDDYHLIRRYDYPLDDNSFPGLHFTSGADTYCQPRF